MVDAAASVFILIEVVIVSTVNVILFLLQCVLATVAVFADAVTTFINYSYSLNGSHFMFPVFDGS